MDWSGKTAVLAILVLLASPSAGWAQTPTTAAPIVVPSPEPPRVALETYRLTDRSAEATCGGRPITPARQEAFAPRLSIHTPHANRWRDAEETGPPLLFEIDGQGRPKSIRPEPRDPIQPVGTNDDLAESEAVLASWRFEPEVRRDCRLTFSGTPVTLDRASPTVLARALALHDDRPPWGPVLRQALQRPGDDCRERPALRTAVNPRLRRSDLPPHGRAWATIRFDVDDEGRPQSVEPLAATSDPGVGAPFQGAVSESRFAPGNPRSGCLGAFSLFGGVDPADKREAPSVDHLNQCSPEVEDRFTHGRLEYPEALNRRSIEGWAVVRYDIASWGAPGAVEVLESEPVSTFGYQARRIVQGGRATPAFAHAAGCVDRVIFRLVEDGEAPNAE